jgi:hypothetical protein
MSNQYDDLYEFDSKPKRKNAEDNYTWGDVFKSLGVFALAITVIGFIGYIVQTVFFAEQMASYFAILGASSPDNPFLALYDNPASLPILMVFSIVVAVLGLMFVYGIVHLVASKFLGGVGSYRGIIVQTLWWNTGTYIAYSVLGGAYNYYMLNRVVELYGDNLRAAATPQFQQELLQLLTPMYLIAGVCWLVWVVGVSMVTGRHYAVSATRGCVTMALSHVALLGLYCGLSFAVVILFMA